MLPASMKPSIASISKLHLLRVDRYFRDAFIVSELVFNVLNDSSRVLSVARGLRLWETSRSFWTILSVSLGMLNRVPSGFFISFFPGPHLRVSWTPRALRVTRIILSHRYALSQNETTCFRFHHWRTKWRAFLRSFRHFRFFFPAERTEWL